MKEDRETTDNKMKSSFCVSSDTDRRIKGYKSLEQRAFLLMLALVSILFIYLLKPFFSVIFWACVIGIVFYPMHKRIYRLSGRPNIAALTTLAVCFLVGVIPVLFILFSFFQEGTKLYQRVQSGDINPSHYIDRIKQGLPAIQNLLERFNVDPVTVQEQLSGMAITASRLVAENAMSIGQNAVQFFIGLALMLYVAFFLLRDGPQLIGLLIRALPLGDERERQLFRKFAEVTRATVKGNLVVAVIQGSLGGFIFWLLDIPGALLWGVVMTGLSLIPLVGAALIWGPYAVYLFAVGEWNQGLILVAFGAGVIGLVDNILRPILVGRDTKLPDYVVLLSTLGGFALFGMNGFVVGPLIAALFFVFWGIFIIEFNNPHNHQTAIKSPNHQEANHDNE
jgi:predicted PurR-regulated permease PerM